METIFTWDNTEARRARPGADLSDLSVVRGAANPGAALQLLKAFLLFQIWGFCTLNKKVMHQVSFDIRTHIFYLRNQETYLSWTLFKLKVNWCLELGGKEQTSRKQIFLPPHVLLYLLF